MSQSTADVSAPDRPKHQHRRVRSQMFTRNQVPAMAVALMRFFW